MLVSSSGDLPSGADLRKDNLMVGIQAQIILRFGSADKERVIRPSYPGR